MRLAVPGRCGDREGRVGLDVPPDQPAPGDQATLTTESDTALAGRLVLPFGAGNGSRISEPFSWGPAAGLHQVDVTTIAAFKHNVQPIEGCANETANFVRLRPAAAPRGEGGTNVSIQG